MAVWFSRSTRPSAGNWVWSGLSAVERACRVYRWFGVGSPNLLPPPPPEPAKNKKKIREESDFSLRSAKTDGGKRSTYRTTQAIWFGLSIRQPTLVGIPSRNRWSWSLNLLPPSRLAPAPKKKICYFIQTQAWFSHSPRAAIESPSFLWYYYFNIFFYIIYVYFFLCF